MSRPRSLLSTVLCLALATATLTLVTAAPAAAVDVLEPVPAAEGSYEYRLIGEDVEPVALNDARQVVATRKVTVNHEGGGSSDYYFGQLWEDGGFTTLAAPDGSPAEGRFKAAYPSDINDTGRIVGTSGLYIAGGDSYSHAAWWSTADPTAAPHDLGILTPNQNNTSAGQAVNDAGDTVSASAIDNDEGFPAARAFYSAAGTGSPLEVGTAYIEEWNTWAFACGISDDGHILTRIDGVFRVLPNAGATGEVFDVENAPYCGNNAINWGKGMASDGTVVGTRDAASFVYRDVVVRDPEGDETVTRASLVPNAVNADGSVAGHITPQGAFPRAAVLEDGVLTDLSGLLPSNFTQSYIQDINDNGDLVGRGVDADFKSYAFLLTRGDASIHGTVLRGSAPGEPFDPPVPVRGVHVDADGTTVEGDAWSGSGVTGTNGRYSISAPPGDYTLTFPKDTCVNDTGPCQSSVDVTVEEGSGVTQDAVVVSGNLAVSVKLDKKNITLARDKKTGKTEPKKVSVRVKLSNTGKKSIRNVTQPDYLIVGYAPGTTPSVPEVPLRAHTGPKPKEPVGTLKPGKSATVSYTLKATGDGKYDIDALVTGTDENGTVLGLGTARLTVGAPVLVTTAEMGKRVKSPDAPKLVKAGTAFTVDVTMENRSYLKSVIVKPLQVQCRGNATDCHLQMRDLPIQDAESMDAVIPSTFVLLEPRQEKKLEIVVRTTNVPADVMLRGDLTSGGSRARVKILEPKVHEFVDGELGDKLGDGESFLDGEEKYEVGLDVRDFKENPEPETWQGYLYYISVGVMQGLWNITTGLVSGIFVGIPTLIGKSITSIPGGVLAYVQAEVELWDAIKDDPAKVAAFTTLVGNATMLAYQEAPGLIEDTGKFYDQIDAAVLAHYTKMHNDWFAGDWRSAVKAFSAEGTERFVDIATALAPGVLARFPKAAEAFQAQKAALYAQVTEDLSVYASRVVGALEAVEVLAAKVKPGFAFSDVHLRQLYGLTYEQATFLRNYAAKNKLLIVVRSRATESVKWIKKFGAVLKPESIKLKNVALLDAKYLGYRASDIGRVVLRRVLPSEADVMSLLRKNGFGPGDAEWGEALARLETRAKELKKTDNGYAKWMDQVADDGEVEMKWNFAENSVDPTAYTDSATKYEFRLRNGGGGNEIPEFYVDGKWRSITGDVDFLQITHGNGAALTDVQRVGVYRDLAKSIVGMLHPESATWTDIKRNLFDFDTKVNEFVRGGTVAQFGPDGLARAVTFNEQMSDFVSKLKYRITWNGGYSQQMGKVAP